MTTIGLAAYGAQVINCERESYLFKNRIDCFFNDRDLYKLLGAYFLWTCVELSGVAYVSTSIKYATESEADFRESTTIIIIIIIILLLRLWRIRPASFTGSS